MSPFSQNLKFLRGAKGLTQAQLAEKTGLTRSVISSYEEGRARPRMQTLQLIAFFFKIEVDKLLSPDLINTGQRMAYHDFSGLRVLTVPVNEQTNEETIPLVNVKATAGYTAGYGDVDYMQALPKAALPYPEISKDKTYRIFQTDGDSMLPVPDKAYLICEFVRDWRQLRNETCCVVVTLNDGVVYKRVINNLMFDGTLLLRSDNPEFRPFSVPAEQILEVWKTVGYTTFSLPDPYEKAPGIAHLETALSRLTKEVKKLKKKK